MTPQEAFDQSTRGIIAQGGPAMTGPHRSYRAPQPDGTVRKCAAGQLLPDEAYDPAMEGKRAHLFLNKLSPIWGLDLQRDKEIFLDSLQSAHDEAAKFGGKPVELSDFWSAWKTALARVAKEYNLNPAVITEIPTLEKNT